MRQLLERVRRILSYHRIRIPAGERDDLEQEVMTQVWRALNQTRSDPTGGIWGLVEVVTSRRCIDWLRKRRQEVPLDPAQVDFNRGPLDRTLDREAARAAAEALASLAEPCRNLIRQRVHDRLSFKEISLRSGKSEEALRVQMHRCIRAARQALQRHGLAPDPTQDASP